MNEGEAAEKVEVDTITLPRTQSLDSNTKSAVPNSVLLKGVSVYKKSRIALDNRQKVQSTWVRKYSINSKTLDAASKTVQRWLRQLHKFGVLVTEQLESASTYDGATNLDLRRLICDAYFLHAAQLRGKVYNVVTGIQVGTIHPRSSLHPSRVAVTAVDTETNVYPWLVFGELFRSTKTYLTKNTPIDPTWLKEAPPVGAPRDAFAANLAGATVVCRTIATTTGALRELVGKRFCKLPALEARLRATVEVEFEPPHITVHAAETDLEAAITALNIDIKRYPLVLQNYTSEAVVVGGTRAVFGAGASVTCALFPGEFVRINLSNLPHSWGSRDLENFLIDTQGLGDALLTSEVVQRGAGEAEVLGSDTFGFAVFETPHAALLALGRLNGAIAGNGTATQTLTCRPGGMPVNRPAACLSSLKLTWSTEPSLCEGEVIFSDVSAANKTLLAGRLPTGISVTVDATTPFELVQGSDPVLFALDINGNAVRKDSTHIFLPIEELSSHVVHGDGNDSIAVNEGMPSTLLGATIIPKHNANPEGRVIYLWDISVPDTDDATIKFALGAAFGPVEQVCRDGPHPDNCATVTFASVVSAENAASAGRYVGFFSANVKLSLPRTSPDQCAPSRPSIPFTLSTGVVSFEVVVRMHGLVVVGWGTPDAKRFDGTVALGFDCLHGTLRAGRELQPFGERCSVGDIVSVVVDFNAKRFVVAKNGVVLGWHVPLPEGMVGAAATTGKRRRQQAELRPLVLVGPSAHVEVARKVLAFKALESGLGQGALAVAGPLLSLNDSTRAGYDDRFTLSLRNLPPDWDEVDLKAWATSFGQVTSVSVFRGVNCSRGAAADDWSLKTEIEFAASVDGVLAQSVPPDEREVITSFLPRRENRMGLSVQLSSAEGGTCFGLLRSAADHVRGARMHGQPLRVEGRIVEHVSIPAGLFQCRRAAFDATVSAAKIAGVKVLARVHGPTFQVMLEARFEGGGADHPLNHALITALDELSISSSAVAYTHANSLAALFTRRGFDIMTMIQGNEQSAYEASVNAGSSASGSSNSERSGATAATEQAARPSPGYITWDRRAQKVQLYGEPVTVAFLKGQLDAFVEAARDMPIHDIFTTKAKMPLARRLCHDLVQIEGVLSAASSSITRLRLQATPEAFTAARNLLRDKGVPLLGRSEASKRNVVPGDCCPICHDVADDGRLVVSCGHTFCIECITPLWRQRDKIPFSCFWVPSKMAANAAEEVPAPRGQDANLPYGGILQEATKAGDRAAIRAIMAARKKNVPAPPAPGGPLGVEGGAQGGGIRGEMGGPSKCGMPIAWRDIENHLGAEDLQQLRRAAWDTFLQRPDSGLRPCFARGCNQVLRTRPTTVRCSDAHGLKIDICVACSHSAKRHVAVADGVHAKVPGAESANCPFAAPNPGAAVEAARAAAPTAAEGPGVECGIQVRCPVLACSQPLHHACDECNAEYCLVCSAQEDAALRAHGVGTPCRIPTQQRRREVEELLMDKCPQCAKFVDFGLDGCFALKCPCGCGICAYCWENCGTDAHEHVRNCTLGHTLGGAGGDDRGLFPKEPGRAYELAKKKRQRMRMRDYFATLPGDSTRRSTSRVCARTFIEFGLNIKELGGPW